MGKDKDVAPNFDAKQLDQSNTWTAPNGEVTAIIEYDAADLKLLFAYLMSEEVCIRFRAMYQLQDQHDIRQLDKDTPMDEAMEIAEGVSSSLYEEMQEANIGDPVAYSQVWMLGKPLVQAIILRMANDIGAEFMGNSEIPDELPPDFH